MAEIELIIGADLVPTSSNMTCFENANVNHLLGEDLNRVLAEARYRIFNLEGPLCDVSAPIVKRGPHLLASEKSISGYKAMKVDLLTLANNHILDHGVQGMETTCKVLQRNGISYVGVGKDVKEASRPYILQVGEKKIGIYACVENEFSVATDTTPGANPFDLLAVFDHITELKKKCDFVLVLYHGGKEHYRYPSPQLQRICQKMVDKGADVVICQHTHCVGCEERYHGGVIVYGQGNFLFDYSNSEFWQTSLLVRIDDQMQVDYVPLVKKNETVRLATGEDAEKILREFTQRSREIQQEGFVTKQYEKYAASMLSDYYLTLSGKKTTLAYRLTHNRFASKLKKLGILKERRIRYKMKVLLGMENILACEAHHELMLNGIRHMRSKLNK